MRRFRINIEAFLSSRGRTSTESPTPLLLLRTRRRPQRCPDQDLDYYYQEDQRTDLLKLVLYHLNSATAPKENRLAAIHAALEEFDHADDALHDEELDLRANHILLQKLTYAACIDPNSAELGYICSALEMVYRASRNRLAASFRDVSDVLLPVFVEMIRPPPNVAAMGGAKGKQWARSLMTSDEGDGSNESRGSSSKPSGGGVCGADGGHEEPERQRRRCS